MVPDDAERDRANEEPAPTSSPTKPVAQAHATGDLTLILSRIEKGEPQAAEQLLPLVYDELRKLAAAKMAQEKPGQTLQATALVHKGYSTALTPKGAPVNMIPSVSHSVLPYPWTVSLVWGQNDLLRITSS